MEFQDEVVISVQGNDCKGAASARGDRFEPGGLAADARNRLEYCEDAWWKLAMFHRTQDMANRLWLKEKFSSFKYTASRISSHVTELEELVLKMQSANCG